MCAMIVSGRLALLLAFGIIAGCASYSPPAPAASTPPRTRCLSNPADSGGLRPLFFLFCVESP
jgi:hypothetical protein